MKLYWKTVFFLVLIFSGTLLKADGDDSYRVEFTLELKNGSFQKGYAKAYHLDDHADSLSDRDYLLRRLTMKYRMNDADILDTLRYFRNSITYSYTVDEGGERISYSHCQLMDEAFLDFSDVKHIRIDHLERGGCGGILNDLKMSDTTWLKNQPLQQITGYGDLCEYAVLIHQKNKAVDALVAELQALTKKHDAIIDQQTMNESGEKSDEYRRMDSELSELFQKFIAHKVVVVQICGC